MTNEGPAACSLEAASLERRLAEIAEIGAHSLISRDDIGGRHLLRFRADEGTRLRLEEVLAAESECCSFLELSLDQDQEASELLLAIAAPRRAQALADGLAAAFAGSRE